jgi:hypothetical protein
MSIVPVSDSDMVPRHEPSLVIVRSMAMFWPESSTVPLNRTEDAALRSVIVLLMIWFTDRLASGSTGALEPQAATPAVTAAAMRAAWAALTVIGMKILSPPECPANTVTGAKGPWFRDDHSLHMPWLGRAPVYHRCP